MKSRTPDAHPAHEFDEDCVCRHCGFDAAEWAHWKKNTYEGRASDLRQPYCSHPEARA